MTQEDKELLLKDLCARLPYGVKVQRYSYENDIETIETLREIDSDGYMSTLECETLTPISKPYLFPLSSMTVGQGKEFATTLKYLPTEEIDVWTLNTYDWCDKNHFDYRGLIPKGLANDATGRHIY